MIGKLEKTELKCAYHLSEILTVRVSCFQGTSFLLSVSRLVNSWAVSLLGVGKDRRKGRKEMGGNRGGGGRYVPVLCTNLPNPRIWHRQFNT